MSAHRSARATLEYDEEHERADELDPVECRRYAEENFAPERMVGDYVRAYEAAAA